MPRIMQLVLDKSSIHYKGKSLRMIKSYTFQDFRKHTVLTDETFTFVDFYFSTRQKTMKYKQELIKERHGNANKFHYKFYWEQSQEFYKAAKQLPIQSSPLASYYSMLNAVKALIAYRTEYIDDFINDFAAHGLNEDNSNANIGDDLNTISIKRKGFGIFGRFGTIMDSDFDDQWAAGSCYTIEQLLYNLPFVHRAYVMTYDKRSTKINELFVPLIAGTSPEFHKGNDGRAYLTFKLDPEYFPPSSTTVPQNVLSTFTEDFELIGERGFFFKSISGAKWNRGSVSNELKALTKELRKQFLYIKSARRLWYLKRQRLRNREVLNVNSMTIILAAMHRFSEIVRYKPEQLNRLMHSKENWLIHEFLTLALDQFIDEIAAEITGQEIMCTAQK